MVRANQNQIVFSMKFEKGTEVKAGELGAAGDEVRITAQSSLPVDYFSRIALSANNLKEITLSNVESTPMRRR
jgi:CRISPR/Cas system-associated exonuclease Cas4 (RecB family)